MVVIADADDSYDWEALPDFVNKIDEGFDLVMGNRFKGGLLPVRCLHCTVILGIRCYQHLRE